EPFLSNCRARAAQASAVSASGEAAVSGGVAVWARAGISANVRLSVHTSAVRANRTPGRQDKNGRTGKDTLRQDLDGKQALKIPGETWIVRGMGVSCYEGGGGGAQEIPVSSWSTMAVTSSTLN